MLKISKSLCNIQIIRIYQFFNTAASKLTVRINQELSSVLDVERIVLLFILHFIESNCPESNFSLIIDTPMDVGKVEPRLQNCVLGKSQTGAESSGS